MAAHGTQLPARVVERPGLADMLAVQVCHLVGAHDPGLREALSAGIGLGAGEANGGFPGRLSRAGGLVDFRRPGFERQPEALEKLPAIT